MSGLESIDIWRVDLALRQPWRTALGAVTERPAILVRAVLDGAEGWGECAALPEPLYSPEYTAGALDVLVSHLVPRLLAAGVAGAAGVGAALAPVKGHHMAKCGLELAVLDAELRALGVPLAHHLASVCQAPAEAAAQVPAGMAIGVTTSTSDLVEAVGRWVAAGLRRVKLKIHPGWDAEPVAAVRAAFGTGLVVGADANGSYAAHPDPAAALAALDGAGLAFVEQPLADDDVVGHAALAARIATPVCLDESLTSVAATTTALSAGACSVVNVKAPRLGGYLEAVRVHDLCRARGVPVWCGGMLETGVGRAANVALAALPNFTIPGDVSGTGWLFPSDVVDEPITFDGAGNIAVPQRPGVGVTVNPAALAASTWHAGFAAPRRR